MIIRQAETKDKDMLQQELENFATINKSYWLAKIDKQDWEVCLALVENQVVGLGFMQHQPKRGLCTIKKLQLKMGFDNLEVISSIIDYLSEVAKKLDSRTVIIQMASNHRLIALMETGRFRMAGYHDRYYGNDGHKSLTYYSLDLN